MVVRPAALSPTVRPSDGSSPDGVQPPVVRTTAPFTGEPLAEIPQQGATEVAAAYTRAREAQPSWAATPVAQRAAILLAYHDLVLDRQDEALDLVQAESGKARLHAFEEVADVALVSRYYGRVAGRLLRTERHRGFVPGLTRAEQVHHPKGVVGIIAPWNYPLTLAVTDALPALVAGNAVVLKPDNQAVLTALWAVELLEEAGLPSGLLQVVTGAGPEVGPAVVDGADHVCFTGSTRTGREVAQRAAARLVGCSLELGGKNPLVVLADADLDRAAEGAVRSCFSSAGQLCVSTERILVETAVHDAFVSRFLARVQAMRVAPGRDWETDMGSLVSPAQLERVSSHVDDAVRLGATVLAGGKARPDLGPLFFEPTVLAGVTEPMACYAEETFGPVVSVRAVADENEAVRVANEGCYGLNASVWTRDTARGRRVATRIRAGTVTVNEGYAPAWGSTAAPMGGMADSGLGRRHGTDGLLRFTEPQTVVTQRLRGLGAPAGLSQQRWAHLVTAGLRLFKRVGL